MIDVNYINDGFVTSSYTDPVLVFEREMQSIAVTLANIKTEYDNAVAPFLLESEITGILTEKNEENINKEKTNVFAKLGKVVKNIVKKVIELADKLIGKVKDLSFSLKSNEKKMELLIKEHPELSKEKIRILSEKGGLDFSDFKSFTVMDKAFDELLEAANNPKVDSKGFRAKYDKFVADLKNDKSGIQTAAKAAVAVTAVIGVSKAISDARKGIAQTDEAARKMKNRANRDEARIYKEMKKNKDIDYEGMGKIQLCLNAFRLKHGKQAQVLGNNVSIITKFVNSVANAADKILGSKLANKVLGDVHGNFKKNKEYEHKKSFETDGERVMRSTNNHPKKDQSKKKTSKPKSK